jgi:hypothetical protein
LIALRSTVFFLFYPALLFAQDETTKTPEYGGPSVLSRGLSPSVLKPSANIRFRPYIGVNGICDSGITAVSLSSTGQLGNATECGIEGTVGIYGYNQWRHTELGLRYDADYRHYPHNTFYNGTEQRLSLALSHRLSRRSRLTLREAAGLYPRNFGLLDASGFLDPNGLPIPISELFDNRVISLSTALDYVYMKSARLSFSFGGQGYLVRRRSSALYGMTGYAATADMSYRRSRYSSIGAAYQFNHYEYSKAFGASDVHLASVLYSARLTRTWELGLSIGAARVESLFVQRVELDPIVAIITGQTFGAAAAYRVNYAPAFGASLAKSFRQASLRFSYNRGVSPGNGVYLTSQQESANAGVNYTGVRYWSFGVSAGYNRLKGLVQTLGLYTGYQAGASVSREIGKGVQAGLRFDERRYDTGISGFKRNSWRASLGLTWSPGEVPFSLR